METISGDTGTMKIAVAIIDLFVKERKSKHQDIGYQRTYVILN